MASCYGDSGGGGSRVSCAEACPYLPIVKEVVLEGEVREISLDVFRVDNESDMQQGMRLMNHVITEGLTWPFLDEFSSVESYSSYFHSHASFAVRFVDTHTHTDGPALLGCFYIKPNFPGRCAHVCNGGFIVNPEYRGLGVGTMMGEAFKRLGKDLGFKSSLFNLVFANNAPSVRLWRKLGFTELACIPKAADLKGCAELVDAYQFYFDFSTLES